MVRPTDTCRTSCGIKFRGDTTRAHKRERSDELHPVKSLKGIPGSMLCIRCLPLQREEAMKLDLVGADISGDEI